VSRRALVVLGLLALLHVAADFAWQGGDVGVQYTDAAYHHSRVVERWRTVDDAEERARLEDKQRYGDLGYAVAATVARATGPEPRKLLVALSLLLWPWLLLATFDLGRRLSADGRESAGLLAAALVGFLPGVFNYMRVVVLDLPLATAVAVAFAGGLRWVDATGPRERRVAGALMGVGVVGVLGLKVNGLAFLLGPALLWGGPRLNRRRWAVVAGAGAVAVVLLTLGQRWGAVLNTLGEATWPGYALAYVAEGAERHLLADWATFVRGHAWDAVYYSVLQTLTPPWVLLAAVGGGLWVRTGRHRGAVAAFAALPLFGLLFLLRGLWDERYVLPLLPVLAAATGAGLSGLGDARVRVPLVVASVLGAGSLFVLVSFPVWPTLRPLACSTLPSWGGSARTGDVWLCALYPEYRFLDRPTTPQRATPQGDQLRKMLTPLARERGQPLRAVFLDDLYDIFYDVHQAELLDPEGLVAGDAILIVGCDDEAGLIAAHGSVAGAEALIDAADLVIVRWNDAEGTAYGRRCGLFSERIKEFDGRGVMALPDGSEARVYLRKVAKSPPGRPPL